LLNITKPPKLKRKRGFFNSLTSLLQKQERLNGKRLKISACQTGTKGYNMAKTILVLGGAGYIGSHTSYLLAKQGYKVIIIDKFVHNQVFTASTVIKEDFAHEETLNHIFSTCNIDAVMHFAACIEVGESVKNPQRFYDNNVVKTIKLLDIMLKHHVKKFIFSSSCAIYGEPIKVPMDETHPFKPISPYGKSKLAIEFVLQDYAHAYGLNYVSLRYFNAAGALPEAGLGEQHNPETHVIPLMLRAMKNQTPFKIFGTDYATPDGSCIRDYIHVLDIAQAHVLALHHPTSDVFNLGSGKGFSVKEMINAVERLYGNNMIIQEEKRRAGDPPVLLANPEKAHKILAWQPLHSDLNNILQSAIFFETSFQAQACLRSTSLGDHGHK
jgi:UDP-glucose-4-epimerase